MALPNLRNKKVLVTGAAMGIGFETALAFAHCGADLILVDIDAEALETAAQVVHQTGVGCTTWTADVANEKAMADLAEHVHATVGPLDVLVNNAGIPYMGPFVATPLERWRRVIDVNVMGVVHGCAFFLPRMLAAGGPRHVVNVASAAGLAPACSMSAYAASKFAVVGLSDTLTMELANSEVSVTVVCPGIINTRITRANDETMAKVVTPAQIERFQTFYRTTGAHPRVVGKAIAAAVQSGRGLVLVGPFSRLIYNLRRISRTLLLKALISNSKKSGFL